MTNVNADIDVAVGDIDIWYSYPNICLNKFLFEVKPILNAFLKFNAIYVVKPQWTLKMTIIFFCAQINTF